MEIAFLIIGAALGGFVNGLTGFGFALMSAGFWLHILPPATVVPLMALSMVSSQLMTLPRVWRMIEPRRAAPLILGGALGIPLGILILPLIPLPMFKLGVAAIIVINLVYTLTLQNRYHLPRKYERFHVVAGFLGGIAGGISALSGVVTTIWAGLFGWSKQEKRGVFQAFNLAMGLFSLLLFWWWGFFDKQLAYTALIAVPVTLLAALFGLRVFQSMGNAGFTHLINGLLGLSAVSLVIAAFASV